MTTTPLRQAARPRPRQAHEDPVLQADVAAMLRENQGKLCRDKDYSDLAHDLVVVIRERTLREIEVYARMNIR